MYGPVPPLVEILAVPVLAPKQLTFVCEATDIESVGHVVVVQGGIDAKVVKVKVRPDATSVTLIGKTPAAGAITVVPEAVHVGTVTPGQNGVHIPPKHPLQLTEVVELAHVYGPLPPLAVIDPELIQTVTVLHDATTIVVVPTPHARLYVITCVPTPAVAGLNVPVVALVIPGQPQVPPGVAACKLKAAAVEHTLGG